jgi:hypothetical protein
MNLTSYQATKIWHSLLANPRVLEVPATSLTEYTNNRNRLNKTRTKLIRESMQMQGLRRFEVSKYGRNMVKKEGDEFAILIRPTHIGSESEDAELAAVLGIAKEERVETTDGPQREVLGMAFDKPSAADVNPLTKLPYPAEDALSEADDILKHLNYAPKSTVGEKKT